MTTLYAFSVLNLLLCSGIGFISICRLNAMEGGVLYRVRSEYAVYLTGATVCGFQPWFGEWPGWGSLSLALALLVGLLCSAHAWRQDKAPPIASGHGELRNADGTTVTSEYPSTSQQGKP